MRHETPLAAGAGVGDIALMNPLETVFVNGRPVVVPAGACVQDALVAFDPSLAAQAASGQAAVADGVGRPIALSAPLTGGAILRVVLSAGATDDTHI